MSFFQEVGLKLIGNNFIKTFKLFCSRYGYSCLTIQSEKFIGMHKCKICKIRGERIDHIKINACRRYASASELLCI